MLSKRLLVLIVGCFIQRKCLFVLIFYFKNFKMVSNLGSGEWRNPNQDDTVVVRGPGRDKRDDDVRDAKRPADRYRVDLLSGGQPEQDIDHLLREQLPERPAVSVHRLAHHIGIGPRHLLDAAPGQAQRLTLHLRVSVQHIQVRFMRSIVSNYMVAQLFDIEKKNIDNIDNIPILHFHFSLLNLVILLINYCWIKLIQTNSSLLTTATIVIP